MSSFFVESVHTLTSTGKTRKGALLQKAASRFEHKVIADEEALAILVIRLDNLVSACNRRYKGAEVKLTYDYEAGNISAYSSHQVDAPYIFSISFAPMGERLYVSSVQNIISDKVNDIDSELLKDYLKEGGKI